MGDDAAILVRELTCLQALLNGDDAWDEFWDLFSVAAIRELALLPIPAELRQDVLQNLVAKLLASRCQPIRDYLTNPQRASFKCLLRVMVRCCGIDLLRRAKAKHEIPLVHAELPVRAAEAWGGDPDRHHAQESQLTELLRHAAGNADKAGFTIMYLRFVEGYSVLEIARKLKMRENTVTQRIRYYLQRLRTHYAVQLKDLGHD